MAVKKLQHLPIGIQDFETLRNGNYLYVDKTEGIYNLVSPESPAYFLSRPRRFGKSMICSTLKALFLAKKELFDGTWIATSDWQWKKHPIIYLSFARIKHATPEALVQNIKKALITIATEYGKTLMDDSPGGMLDDLIVQLEASDGKVVMIVDEYDKPIIDNLQNIVHISAMRTVLKDFYSSLKDLSSKMRVLFITGVSQFSMVSIFSDLNHLQKLSFHRAAATICGYTQTELEHSFAPYIEMAVGELGLTRDELLAEIKHWYNGYLFANPELAPDRVYNPFSVINFFSAFDFQNFWFASGTPTFVIDYFKKEPLTLKNFQEVKATESELSSMLPEQLNPTTLLYQTGYLTIKRREGREYILGFPNQELASASADSLLQFSLKKMQSPLPGLGYKLGELFRSDAFTQEKLLTILKNICVCIPYPVAPDDEKDYQMLLFITLQFAGIDSKVEVPTAEGRIDILIFYENRAYIVELKIKGSAEKAQQQIEDKHYDALYQLEGKDVTRIAIVYDVDKHTIKDCSIVKPSY